MVVLVISGAIKEVREFADLVDAPVCDSLMGKGAFPMEQMNDIQV